MRKLAWSCGGFSLALIITEYWLPRGLELWSVLAALALGLPALLLRGKQRRIALFLLLGAAFGFFRGWLHTERVLQPVRELDGETVTAQARVLEYPEIYGRGQYVTVRLTGDGTPPVKCRLTSYKGGIAGLRPGDQLKCELSLRSSGQRWGQETSRYSSKGVFLLGSCESAPEKTGEWRYSFLYAPRRWAERIVEQCREVFPEDTAPFMEALLSGDRGDLYQQELRYARLSRAGLAHVVAVSGMHISFLMGFVWLLCGNRKRAALAGMPMLLCFAALAGFTPSVVRAGFMQAYLLSAGLVNREADTATSLSAILAVLLMVNPSAAASISLQLSFAATAGILAFSGRIYRALSGAVGSEKIPGPVRKAALAVIGSVSTTLGATVFTMPLTALHFGYIALLSLLSNLLCLWMISILFVGGYLAVLCGFLFPALGKIAGWVFGWGVRYIFGVVALIVRVPHGVLYTDNPLYLWWMGLSYALILLVCLLARQRKTLKITVSGALSLAVLAILVVHVQNWHTDKMAVTALDVGQGQCILLTSGDHTAMINCGSGAVEENAGDTASQYLLSREYPRVDALFLTQLHRGHAGGVTRLLSAMEVDTLYVPREAVDKSGLLSEILAVARETGTVVYYLSDDMTVQAGDMSFTVMTPRYRPSDKQRGFAVYAARNGFAVLVTGDLKDYAEKDLLKNHDLPTADVLVAGCHGSKYSTCPELLDAVRPGEAIISVGYNYYGHPADEVLDRLSRRNIEIFRTDQLGTVTRSGD